MKNCFKYICGDCGEATFLSARRRTSRSAPRCAACGSTRLDPSEWSIAPYRLLCSEQARRVQMDDRQEQQNIGKSTRCKEAEETEKGEES
jgi:hypothetical protein